MYRALLQNKRPATSTKLTKRKSLKTVKHEKVLKVIAYGEKIRDNTNGILSWG